jgi:murein DD-endopeptidase MepM/ murein hydrolase activator NlpD
MPPSQSDDAAGRQGPQRGRKGNKTLLRLFLLLAIGCMGWYVCGIIGGDRPKAPLQEAACSPLVPPPLETARRLITHIVRPGETFLGILGDYGVSRDVANACYRSLRPLGFFSMFPNDSCVLTMGDSGSLFSFSVQNRLQNWYKLTLSGRGVKAEKSPVALSTCRCLVRGVLISSLSEDMVAIGSSDACVAKFADIFAWDINFFVDPQPGDSFEMVIEKKFAEGRFLGYGDILAARYITFNGRVYDAIAAREDGEPLHYYDLDGKSLQKQFLKAPLRYSHISSKFTFHRRHPVLGIVRPHLGVDYAAPVGTPVYSAADGKVVSAGPDGGYGNHVRISHGGSYETSYGHLSSFSRGIQRGALVKQGDCIGWVGQTGLATGPHLDYRMTRAGSFVNPLTVSLPRKSGVGLDQRKAFDVLKKEYSMIFTTRFAGVEGVFALDFEPARAPEPLKGADGKS